MSQETEHVQISKLTKTLINILYDEIVYLRKQSLTRMIALELIVLEERIIRFLGLFYFHKLKIQGIDEHNFLLNVWNMFKVLNCPKEVIQVNI